MKKIITNLLLLIIIFFTSSCSNISKYYGSSKLYLDETGVVNFMRYLEGRFYAENTLFSRSSRIMTPMYYAISENGKVGYGWFCDSHTNANYGCKDDTIAYQVVEYCKEYSKKDCYIFAVNNKIVWNKLDIIVSKMDFDQTIQLLTRLNLYNAEFKQTVNQNNYKKYLYLDDDECIKKKKIIDYKYLRGASLHCLLVGRYEDFDRDSSIDLSR